VTDVNQKLVQIFKIAAMLGAQAVPGGPLVERAVENMISHGDHNADGKVDDQDTEAEILDTIIGSMQGVEGVTNQDIVNDPVLLYLSQNILRDIDLFRHQLIVKHAAAAAAAPAAAGPA
jgi:hypothetical protein